MTLRLLPAKTGHDRSEISDLSHPACRVGGHCACRAPLQHRACHSADALRYRSRLRAGHAAGRTAAGTGTADGAAAADLLGQRRHELARVQEQFTPDRAARGRRGDLHRGAGGGRHALCDWPALGYRLPARRHCRAARRGGTARDRAPAAHAAPASGHPRRRRARQRRYRADPLSFRARRDHGRAFLAAFGSRRVLAHRRQRDRLRHRRRLAVPCACANGPGIRRSS
ncbi:hypothetical protein ACVWWP_008382 [Bradyrhizobium sp. LM3.6]